MTSNRSSLTAQDPSLHFSCGITGVTGFVGGALAARLLSKSQRVVALLRSLDQSAQALANIQRSAAGLGLTLPENWSTQLTFDELKPKSTHFDQCNVIVHSAANMDYNLNQVDASVSFNSGYSTWLMNRCAESKRNPLFIYVSTAYVSPERTNPIPELFHDQICGNNSYQLSKCIAESALVSLAKNHSQNLVLFRPSVIVGSPRTGFGPKKSNGFYKFVDAFDLAKKFGKAVLHFPLNPQAIPNFVSITSVTAALEKIIDKAQFINGIRFFHCAGQSQLSNQILTQIVSSWFSIHYQNSEPTSALEKKIEKNLISLNAPFSNQTWTFCVDRLNEFIGTDWQDEIGIDSVRQMIQSYIRDKYQEAL